VCAKDDAMNAKQQAFEDLKRLSAMFRGLFDAGGELARIGSLEQAASEAAARIEALRSEEERLAAALQAREDAAREAAARAAAECETRLAERQARRTTGGGRLARSGADHRRRKSARRGDQRRCPRVGRLPPGRSGRGAVDAGADQQPYRPGHHHAQAPRCRRRRID
jgi:hypothetical protein